MQRTKRIRLEEEAPGRWLATYQAERKGRKRYVKIVYEQAKRKSKTIDSGGLPHKVTQMLEKELTGYMNARLRVRR